MKLSQRLRNLEQNGWFQTIELIVGILLILISPLFGAVPGPGGIFVFAAGLALVLRTSMWAKRRYVRFKRWQPKAGQWTDWGLRRRSFLRRQRLDKLRKERADRDAESLSERRPDC